MRAHARRIRQQGANESPARVSSEPPLVEQVQHHTVVEEQQDGQLVVPLEELEDGRADAQRPEQHGRGVCQGRDGDVKGAAGTAEGVLMGGLVVYETLEAPKGFDDGPV